MNICEYNEFTFNSAPEEFSLFYRAELPECGKHFSLPAPRLLCGVLLSVRPDGSIAYTVAGECSRCFTVTAFPAPVKTAIVPRELVKRPRRNPVQQLMPMPFRKTTFLRL